MPALRLGIRMAIQGLKLCYCSPNDSNHLELDRAQLNLKTENAKKGQGQ